MKIGFYSCMTGMPWGGSEELWWRAARKLQSQGHEVCVNYKYWPFTAKQLLQIQNHGGQLWLRNRPRGFWEKKIGRARRMFGGLNGHPRTWLHQTKPDIVLVSLGFHPDRVEVARECLELGIPYAINIQCASDSFFIHSDVLDEYREWYRHAAKVFFVSDENRRKMETNLAIKLDNYEIVANPFNIDPNIKPPWPQQASPLKIACVGRLHFQSKGQDIIVDVFRNSKWRQRDVVVNFYGSDQGHRRHLEDLIDLHQLGDQLNYQGFVNDIADVWAENHALLLPSRYEGAPLVIVEAMLCRRIVIATDIGRNTELLDDGKTGFIAESATVTQMDDALERAWQARQQWQSLGELAGQQIRERYSLDPVGDFAQKLQELVIGSQKQL